MPPRYQRLLDVLDIFEQNLSPSYKENNPTYLDEVFCLKGLLIGYLDEIKEEFYKKESYELDYIQGKPYPKIQTLLALVLFSGSNSVLKGYLEFIKSQGIKIPMNDGQMEIDNELNIKITSCKNGNGHFSYTHSPSEYVAQRDDVDRLNLLIDYGKKVGKDASLDLKDPMLMASYYGHFNTLKALIQAGRPIDSHTIMHLINSGHLSVVLQLLNEGFIDEQKLIIKDDSVGTCYLENVFISIVNRYMNIVAPIVIVPLKPQLQEELKLLGNLFKFLIDKGVNILEKNSDGINTLVDTIFYSFGRSRKLSRSGCFEYMHKLILLLSKHPNFERVIDEVSSTQSGEFYTLRSWEKEHVLPEIKKLYKKEINKSCLLS